MAQARAGYQEALRLAQELGDKAAIQQETHELAVLDARAGEVTRARAGYLEALRLAQELGDPAAQAIELMNLGINDRKAGGLTQAGSELRGALVLARQVGQPLLIARTLNSLGFLARDEGDRAGALRPDWLARGRRAAGYAAGVGLRAVAQGRVQGGAHA